MPHSHGKVTASSASQDRMQNGEPQNLESYASRPQSTVAPGRRDPVQNKLSETVEAAQKRKVTADLFPSETVVNGVHNVCPESTAAEEAEEMEALNQRARDVAGQDHEEAAENAPRPGRAHGLMTHRSISYR